MYILDEVISLQEFDPEPGRYDIIWCQWVLGHLTDGKLIPVRTVD